jgi:cytochrome c biogenesis protein CcmG, thiol:disulfide interchange protein DsbE
MKRWLPLILFVALVGFFAKGLFLNPREVPSPFIGRQAPAFTLPLVGDANASFSPAEMKGRVWMLNVWAPWCVSCRQEHGFLMQLAQVQPVPIVGLNWKDKSREADMLLARTGSPYFAVPDDVDGRVGIDYGVTGTPETYIIDKQGIVQLKHVGPIDPETWKNKFEPKLKELGA